jgi:acetylornithine deacetylase/succinyl-diaminopimelate desuccinylase-like protein
MKEPVNLPWDHPGVLAIQEATRAVTGQAATVATSPFVCDANYWHALDQPSLVFGCGDPSWGIHGVDEHLPIADLLLAVKLFAAVSIGWCGLAEI